MEKCFEFDIGAYLSEILEDHVIRLDLNPEEGESRILEIIGHKLWNLYTGEGWK